MIKIPGSKSITQRALICASLSNGVCRLKNPLICEDSEFLIGALKDLGIKIKILKDEIIIYGNNAEFKNNGKKKIYMSNNGTGLRFLITLTCFYPEDVILYGNERMNNRPVDELVDCLINAGFKIDYLEKKGYPPVLIKKLPTTFNLLPSTLKINSTKSSQFVSSLLLSGVLFKNGVKIEVNDIIPSKPYINMTLKVMEDFGVKVQKNSSTFHLPPSTYRSKNYTIESDFSSASYFFISPFFLEKPVTIENIDYYNSFQPDKHFLDVLIQMGANVEIKDNLVKVYPSKLHPIEIDMNKMPDVVPTLAVLCSIIKGETVIKNIEHLRYKECDRINAIEVNLKKFGVKVESDKDYLKIRGMDKKEIIDNYKDTIKIETYNDHRIVMSFAIFKLLGLNLEFDNKECVKKSFPDFWKYFEKIIDK